MSIFLDTANLTEIKRFYSLGIIRGVTTNPTLLRREGITYGISGIEASLREIAELIAPFPLAVEVTSTGRAEMLLQAQKFASWADNIVVKITVHGPNGELENLEVVHELVTKQGIQVNVTAMMSAQQCLLAALAGASYLSLFGGRVNDMGYNVSDEISKLRKVLDQLKLKSQIVVGSTREALNVIEWLEAGAHIVTAVPRLLERMLIHPYSKEVVQAFLKDAASIEGTE